MPCSLKKIMISNDRSSPLLSSFSLSFKLNGCTTSDKTLTKLLTIEKHTHEFLIKVFKFSFHTERVSPSFIHMLVGLVPKHKKYGVDVELEEKERNGNLINILILIIHCKHFLQE